MKRWKKYAGLLLALVLCLSLTACKGSDDAAGDDWRNSGEVVGRGIITRDGEDTDVLLCIHAADTEFYYDTEEQVLFDSVDYPITIESDAWEAFQSIDFADLNGDGNSDVTMRFYDGGSDLLMVWFWDTESEQFMYQPEESQLGEDDDGRGDLVPDDDGQGDLVPDDGDAVPVLMSDALPFANIETLQSENHEDGTYYYEDMAEDGLILVVNTVLPRNFVDDAQTLEDYQNYLIGCALDLGKADTDRLQTVEQNDAYTRKMSYPVYIVTYTTGENEDSREWTVFAMDTDRYTYLYGICVTLDAADDFKPLYQDIFAGLDLSY